MHGGSSRGSRRGHHSLLQDSTRHLELVLLHEVDVNGLADSTPREGVHNRCRLCPVAPNVAEKIHENLLANAVVVHLLRGGQSALHTATRQRTRRRRTRVPRLLVVRVGVGVRARLAARLVAILQVRAVDEEVQVGSAEVGARLLAPLREEQAVLHVLLPLARPDVVPAVQCGIDLVERLREARRVGRTEGDVHLVLAKEAHAARRLVDEVETLLGDLHRARESAVGLLRSLIAIFRFGAP